MLMSIFALTPAVAFTFAPISRYPPKAVALPPPVCIDVVNIPPTMKYGPAEISTYALTIPQRLTVALTLIISETSIFPSI